MAPPQLVRSITGVGKPGFDLSTGRFPRTRYQGSKRKLASAIVAQLRGIEFDTVLDAFGGTGSVAYALKAAGKRVTYNDHLQCNHQIGLAMVENDSVRLSAAEIEGVGMQQSGVTCGNFIERTFQGIYFTRPENQWLDVAVGNVKRMTCPYKRALAWFALFQSALAKRPYNLFHRKNLYMRAARVKRSFGNKASWDRSFADHFRVFAAEANAAVTDSGGCCQAICKNVLDVEPGFELVYIDPPYINRHGVGVNYHQFYHFLEGMVRYEDWPGLIDYRSKHRRLFPGDDPWSDARRCHSMFRRLFERFAESILVVSYRDDGIPTIDELAVMLRRVRSRVEVVELRRYQYALSPKHDSHEFLLVALSR